mmetsp:Transcript_18244/g.57377  ORF Transcript_18244/g.57377 Transcript_18244/m.57377 type:complete len:223 (-) Transcript_18244:1184-1852(-)
MDMIADDEPDSNGRTAPGVPAGSAQRTPRTPGSPRYQDGRYSVAMAACSHPLPLPPALTRSLVHKPPAHTGAHVAPRAQEHASIILLLQGRAPQSAPITTVRGLSRRIAQAAKCCGTTTSSSGGRGWLSSRRRTVVVVDASRQEPVDRSVACGATVVRGQIHESEPGGKKTGRRARLTSRHVGSSERGAGKRRRRRESWTAFLGIRRKNNGGERIRGGNAQV